jgi:hypothetical protein
VTDTDSVPVADAFDLDEPDWKTSFSGFPIVEPEFVCSVAEALETGDEVIINDRSRPLTVTRFEEDRHTGVIGGSDYPYHVLWLRGNGTEYRMRWSHLCEHSPHLHTESDLESGESFSIKHGEPRPYTRATGQGTTVRWLCPAGVDKGDLTDWVIARSIECLEVDDGE